MVNIIEKQQENKELLNEIELLKQQLADKDRELNDYKNTEVNEQEEAEFKQNATERIHQMLVEMRNSLMHDYNWKEKENLEEVVERIVIDHFESTELATDLLKD
ncbi:8816_t:CDS:2 [Paraglomus brasilianum]|uniref:8816_t:CDS:1 n=1 Tax=Paraglomus brasilianum TaxID=144538 RepID=A0A9N9H7R7_9GLOM|nr:8816_t:CDS:2 [Paraglomus brasilianum]